MLPVPTGPRTPPTLLRFRYSCRVCGFGGILRADGGTIDDALLDRLDDAVEHRGPDGCGRFRDRAMLPGFAGGPDVQIAFVHRRLSIIDLADGQQPMVSPRGRSEAEGLVAVAFNGCIYNHRDLRRRLTEHGHRFVTDHSDTEVLIHGWREWGINLPDHLEGMYAFALWDRERASLVLARDPFGEKPLYYGIRENRGSLVIAFGSAAHAVHNAMLSLAPSCAEEQEQERRRFLVHYLQSGYTGASRGCWFSRSGTTHLPARTSIVFDLRAPAPKAAIERQTALPEAPLEATFEDLIELSIARRLESDVPLGCFLSGGVDSSLIAHFAKRHQPDLRTFSVRMPDPRYDESLHAQHVARHLQTEHLTLDVRAHPAEDLLKLIRSLGCPFGDSSILPTYWVSHAAREHVKVALSGDGGDEMFVGYERYLFARTLVRHGRLLQWLPSSSLMRAHPKSFLHKAGRAGRMAEDYLEMKIVALESMFSARQIRELAGDSPSFWSVDPGDDALRTLRDLDLRFYLPQDLMTKVDTASMAVALEVRCPLLDRDLASCVLATPIDKLIPGGRRKGLLRAIARQHLPREIVDRPKMGFAIPVGEWFRTNYGGMRTLLLDSLGSSEPFGAFKLNSGSVRRLLDEHRSGRLDHGERLFALLTLSIWAREES